MQSLKNILDQILLIWRTSTPAARLGIGLLTLACIAIISGVGYWSVQPNYVELTSGLESAKMQEVMTALDRAGIKHELQGGGNLLMVDQRAYARAQLIASEFDVQVENDQMALPGPLDNPLSFELVQQHNRERSLAAAIKRFAGVAEARVMLALPKNHAFIRSTEPPRAAVSLTLQPKHRFTDENASAIAAMVASSVSGMARRDVTVTDQFGNVYAIEGDGQRSSGQIEEARAARELSITEKILSMLVETTGYDNVKVAVSADMSFAETNSVTTRFDPENRGVLAETKSTTSKTQDDEEPALGAAGIASQLSSASSKRKSVLNKTEDTTTSYVNSKTEQNLVDNTPKLNRLSISVVVNSKRVEETASTANPITQEQIETIVKRAAGFDDTRDAITVEFLPFLDVPEDVAVPPATIPWDQINQILRNVSLAVAAVVAVFVGWGVMKRFKPGPLRGAMGLALSEDGVQRVSQLTQLAEKNPEVFAKIIAAWAKASEPGKANEKSTAKAA